MTAWSVRPLHPAPGKPATAVTIHADDATAREGVYDLARMMTAEQFAHLRGLTQTYDVLGGSLGYKSAEECRVAMDDLLDEVCRALGHDLTGLWRVRVGVEELPAFRAALIRATWRPIEGDAA